MIHHPDMDALHIGWFKPGMLQCRQRNPAHEGLVIGIRQFAKWDVRPAHNHRL